MRDVFEAYRRVFLKVRLWLQFRLGFGVERGGGHAPTFSTGFLRLIRLRFITRYRKKNVRIILQNLRSGARGIFLQICMHPKRHALYNRYTIFAGEGVTFAHDRRQTTPPFYKIFCGRWSYIFTRHPPGRPSALVFTHSLRHHANINRGVRAPTSFDYLSFLLVQMPHTHVLLV